MVATAFLTEMARGREVGASIEWWAALDEWRVAVTSRVWCCCPRAETLAMPMPAARGVAVVEAEGQYSILLYKWAVPDRRDLRAST